MMSAEQLSAAVNAAKVGKREDARQMLLALVETEPEHELAWLWLSELMPDLENRIIALENALAINPHRQKAQQRLAQLRQQQEALVPQRVVMANTYAENGRRQQAYTLLQQQLQKQPDDADAWFAFSQLVEDVDDQIAALHYAVMLKPTHNQAQQRLTQLLLAHDDLIGLGRAYEALGDLDNAIPAYQLAVKQSTTPTIDQTIAKKRLEAAKRYRKLYHQQQRKGLTFPELTTNQSLATGRAYEEKGEWEAAIIAYKTAVATATATAEQKIAQKRLHTTQKQQQLPNVKLTSPTLTLVRLGLGPFLLFIFLVLLHAGLNPLHISPWLALSSLSVLAGSLLLVLAMIIPHHNLAQKLLGESERPDFLTRILLNVLGNLLIALPFLLLIFNAIDRLSVYTPVIPIP
ncbi:MAG: hypothetical protein R3E31_30610 [Chloroflexota bacterium]